MVKRFEYGNHINVAVILYGEQNIFITAKYLCQLLILLFDVVNDKIYIQKIKIQNTYDVECVIT